MGITFLCYQVFSCGRFQAIKCVSLDMHRFCLFDNWLCEPIPVNWQLTLDKNVATMFILIEAGLINVRAQINAGVHHSKGRFTKVQKGLIAIAKCLVNRHL